MNNCSHLILLLTAFCLLFPSCVSKKKWEELVAQKTDIESSLASTQTQVSNLESDLSGLKEENSQLESDYMLEKKQLNEKMGKIESDLNMVQKEKKELAESLKGSEEKFKSLASSVKAPFSAYSAKGFSLAPEGNMLYLKGIQDIRYKSGSARVTKESKEMLKSLASLLSANPSMHLLIEGHTDAVPMKAGASYASNAELSLARARAVVKYLVKQGAAKSQLSATGHGSSKPKAELADNGSKDEVNSMNRRAEIVVMTSPTNFYNLSQTL